MYKREWHAIGKFLVKAFLDTRYFTTMLSRAFVNYCLFEDVECDDLIFSFRQYVSSDERQVLQQTLSTTENEHDVFPSDELLELLDTFKCRTKVSSENVKDIISEIGRQELIQKHHLMAACWKDSFGRLKQEPEFCDVQAVRKFYVELAPTNKNVIKLLDASPSDDAEREALNYFKRYIR